MSEAAPTKRRRPRTLGEAVDEVADEPTEDAPLAPDEIEQQREEEEREQAEPEPEPEPEAPESRLPLIQVDGDRALREAEKAMRRHESDMRAIFGEQFVANLCPHCEGVGYLEQPPPKPHPDYRRCATCNGYGKILTGALEGANAFAECPTCSGRGYEQRPIVAQAAQQVPPPNGTTGDGWERPSWMGDPQIAGPPPPQPTWNPTTGT